MCRMDLLLILGSLPHQLLWCEPSAMQDQGGQVLLLQAKQQVKEVVVPLPVPGNQGLQ